MAEAKTPEEGILNDIQIQLTMMMIRSGFNIEGRVLPELALHLSHSSVNCRVVTQQVKFTCSDISFNNRW